MRTKRFATVVPVFFLLATLCPGQDKEWDRRFGGSDADYLRSIELTDDGGYILAGSSHSGIGGDKSEASRGGYDYWILKLDSVGAKQSDKRYGGASSDWLTGTSYFRNETIHRIRLVGYSESGNEGDKSQASRGLYDFWGVSLYLHTNDASTIIKQFDYRFGGINDEMAMSVAQNRGMGAAYRVLIAGHTDSPAGGDITEASRGGCDYWYVDVSYNGVKVLDKRFGGGGQDMLSHVESVPTGARGVLLAGYSNSGIGGDKTQASRGGYDYWVVRVDTNGVKQWDRRFGGSGHDYCRVARYTTDDGFILGGTSYSGQGGDKTEGSRGGTDYWVVKIAANGDKQWDRRFGGAADDELCDLIQTTDGGYLLAGVSASGISGDKTQNLRGVRDYWIVKIDANGNIKWDRRFGGTNADDLAVVKQTPDGGFILGGTSLSGQGGDKSQISRGGHDYWIVKVSSEPPPPQPEPDLTKPHLDMLQPVVGHAVNRWSFLTAWNLTTGTFYASPQWRNGVYTWDHPAAGYQEWIARFVYDQASMQTRSLAWYYRQVHVQ